VIAKAPTVKAGRVVAPIAGNALGTVADFSSPVMRDEPEFRAR
jgi:hypothetical protein